MAVTAQSILSDIRSGNLAPLYFLQGEEAFYIDQISDLIPEKALSEGEREFNLTVVYGRDSDVISVLNHARRFPMMAQRQVVIVKEAQQLQDIGRENGKKQLEAYCNEPVPTTVLVFCHKNKKLDQRTSLAKTIAKKGILLTTKKLYENQVPDWINDYVRGKNGTISPKATQLLTEYIGNNLERLSNELDKIFVNFEDQNVAIDENLIQEYVGINKEYNVFELQKALLVRDREKSFRIVNYFNSNPKANPHILTIFQLYGLFSKLLVATEHAGSSNKELASALRVNPYFVNDYVTGLRNYTVDKIISAIHEINEADAKLKGVNSGSISPESVLSELIFRILK